MPKRMIDAKMDEIASPYHAEKGSPKDEAIIVRCQKRAPRFII